MIKILIVTCSIAILTLSSNAQTTKALLDLHGLKLLETQSQFASNFNYYLQNPEKELPPAEKLKLSQFSIVLVAGFGNEIAKMRNHNYLIPNAETFNKNGVENIKIISPSSFNSAEYEIKVMRDELYKLYNEGGKKPLIAIGHSRGGLLLIATVLEYPELILNGYISQVITIQSPVAGSHLADQSIKSLGPMALLPVFNGLYSLTTNKINIIIEEKIEKLESDAKKVLSERIFYVISSQKPKKMHKLLGVGSQLFDLVNVKHNDGIMAKSDMWVPGFGSVIANLKADHLELVMPENSELVRSKPYTAQAFTMALAKNILNYTLNINSKTERDLNPVLLTKKKERPKPASTATLCRTLVSSIIKPK